MDINPGTQHNTETIQTHHIISRETSLQFTIIRSSNSVLRRGGRDDISRKTDLFVVSNGVSKNYDKSNQVIKNKN